MVSDWREHIDEHDRRTRPHVRGTNVWIEDVLDAIATGSIPAALEAFPVLREEHVRACIAYAAELARRSYVEAKIQRGLADVAAGRVVPDEEVMRRLGLEEYDEDLGDGDE